MRTKIETRSSKFEPRLPSTDDFRIWISEFGNAVSRWMLGLAAAVVVFAHSSVAYAQGCALCANSASALKAGALAALRSGILILMVPPVLISIGIFVFAYRNRNRFNDENVYDSVDEQELSNWLASMPEDEGSGIETAQVEHQYPGA